MSTKYKVNLTNPTVSTRLTLPERDRFRNIASAYGLTPSELLYKLISVELNRLGPMRQTKKRTLTVSNRYGLPDA